MRAVIGVAALIVLFAIIMGCLAWVGAKGSSRESRRALKQENSQLRLRLAQAEETIHRIDTLAHEDRAIEANILSTQVIDEVLIYQRELGK